jgi:hypothetical protein
MCPQETLIGCGSAIKVRGDLLVWTQYWLSTRHLWPFVPGIVWSPCVTIPKQFQVVFSRLCSVVAHRQSPNRILAPLLWVMVKPIRPRLWWANDRGPSLCGSWWNCKRSLASQGNFGNLAVINHAKGYQTRYMPNWSYLGLTVKVGQVVKAGRRSVLLVRREVLSAKEPYFTFWGAIGIPSVGQRQRPASLAGLKRQWRYNVEYWSKSEWVDRDSFNRSMADQAVQRRMTLEGVLGLCDHGTDCRYELRWSFSRNKV